MAILEYPWLQETGQKAKNRAEEGGDDSAPSTVFLGLAMNHGFLVSHWDIVDFGISVVLKQWYFFGKTPKKMEFV